MKKIAFIKDGIVIIALNTDESLFDAFLNSDLRIDISDVPDVESGWVYDGVNFIEPEKPSNPEL